MACCWLHGHQSRDGLFSPAVLLAILPFTLVYTSISMGHLAVPAPHVISPFTPSTHPLAWVILPCPIHAISPFTLVYTSISMGHLAVPVKLGILPFTLVYGSIRPGHLAMPMILVIFPFPLVYASTSSIGVLAVPMLLVIFQIFSYPICTHAYPCFNLIIRP